MANPEHTALLDRSWYEWNKWRQTSDVRPDLRHATLFREDLTSVDLRKADLRHAILILADLTSADLDDANLRHAHLNEAILNGAHLQHATLVRADLRRAKVYGTNLCRADLRGANLIGADLTKAKLTGAKLRRASLVRSYLYDVNLVGADLRKANLFDANLRGADLSKADLSGADLRLARLQSVKLDGATLTGVKLWETQRTGWSIKGVTCGSAFWDKEGVETTHYALGEFERLYSDQPRIELFYKDGLTTFELNTLPALLKHLTTLHPDSSVRLKSIQETGGGTTVSISVEDVDNRIFEEIRAEATQAQAAQMALRDNEIARLEVERRYMLDEIFPRMLAAGGQKIHIDGSATGLIIANGQASINAQQHINDLSAIQPLLQEIVSRRTELPLTDNQAIQFEKAVREVQSELQKAQPNHPIISKCLEVVRDFVINATGSAAGTALAANWDPLVNQITHVIY